ncbi:probable splicing factor, arginine/serine-rich 5 [Cataglyphis hispanica]|uniref:probable splicing factor, arginine/serine-rich 5 n=1 Tax=Cataglyphis hispanica TaxID=1086592 RepID=UPI00217F5478|nr:probable splicing factor, arginine/serine-rich 5 [Cataglyphis hispanica]
MVRIKRHRNIQSHQRTKPRRRKPNIPELIYKFLGAERALSTECRCYNQENVYHDEVVDSADTSRIASRSMGYGVRKDNGRVSKARRIKRPTSRDRPISYLQKFVGGKDTRKVRKYIKKALDFAVESGYLIPSDSTYKVLRVSSDLMKSDPRTNRINTCDKALSKERESPTKQDDLQVQEQRRRRGRRPRRRSRIRGRRLRSRSRRRRSRRGRRRRSRSRSRSRYSSPQSSEEVAENEADDYEMDENDRKSNIHADDIEREPKTTRSNQSDEGQSMKKTEENGSDLSVDEDETDDDEEKKRTDITKS